MNRRALLRAVMVAPLAAAAAPLIPLAHRASTSPLRGIPEGVQRFSAGTLRFRPYDPNQASGPYLGWIENAKGTAVAFVDVTRRVWWQAERALPNGGREVFLERGSQIP